MNKVSRHVATMLAATFAAGAVAQEGGGLHGADPLDPMDSMAAESAVPEAPVRVPPAVAAERVRDAIDQAEGVSGDDVSVSSHAGTIVVTGEVSNEAAVTSAEQAAAAAADGARVTTDLSVRPMRERSPADQQRMQLVRDVDQALKADARTSSLGVVVSSDEQGIIVLHGLVPTAEGRTLARDLASRVAGVTRVESRMIVPQD